MQGPLVRGAIAHHLGGHHSSGWREWLRRSGEQSADDGLEPSIREVASPLTRRMLRPLDPRCEIVQFRTPLSDDEHRRLADWLIAYPAVTLRAWGSVTDLEFLRFYPQLRRFAADTFYEDPESFEGLRHLRPDLHSLALGSTRRRLSLHPLAGLTGLRRLYVEGQAKDIDVLAGLTSLTSLTLRSITLPDLSLLLPLTRLRALDLKLGGTHDLSLLPSLGQLEYLELWLVRGLHDLGPVADVTTLRHLFVQALKQVTALPDLSRLARLETVHLESMKGITDLAPLLTAPALRQLALVDMGHLQPADVAVLARHPSLRFLIAGLNSEKKNRAVRESWYRCQRTEIGVGRPLSTATTERPLRGGAADDAVPLARAGHLHLSVQRVPFSAAATFVSHHRSHSTSS